MCKTLNTITNTTLHITMKGLKKHHMNDISTHIYTYTTVAKLQTVKFQSRDKEGNIPTDLKKTEKKQKGLPQLPSNILYFK